MLSPFSKNQVQEAELYPSGVSVEQLKQALGPSAEGLSDEEIRKMNNLLERLSGALFESWSRKLAHPETSVAITTISDRI